MLLQWNMIHCYSFTPGDLNIQCLSIFYTTCKENTGNVTTKNFCFYPLKNRPHLNINHNLDSAIDKKFKNVVVLRILFIEKT